MDIVSAKELKEKLKREKTVQVCGLSFRIRRIPLLLLAEEHDDLWAIARQGQDVLDQKIKALISSPTLHRLRRTLSMGIVHPKVSAMEEDEVVCIDDLLTDYQLSVGLFTEIITFSLEAT
jgi:hypothetical protein